MAEPASAATPAAPVGRVSFPGAGTALVVLAVVFLPVGALTLLGTSSRDYFENAPTQASVGALMIVIGAGALIGVAVIAGVRSIVRQYLAQVRG